MFKDKFLANPVFAVGAGSNPLDSLHIYNYRLPEPYWWYMHSKRHFEESTVVIHGEGHRPPKNLTID
jgi:hypothetical protein